jgi:KDO2-lipid IV(A) lauroyltransferase
VAEIKKPQQTRRLKAMTRRLSYWALLGAMKLVRRMSLRHARRLLARLSAIGFKLNRTEYQRTMRHLELAFGATCDARRRREIAERFFRHVGQTFAEMVHMPQMSAEEIRGSFVRLDGMEHARAALEKGRGLVFVTGHVGNWELAGAYLPAVGIPLSVAARRIYYEPFNTLLVANRDAAQVKTVFQDQGLRPLLRALRNNGAVGLLADQDLPRFPGVFVPLFGQPAHTPTGPFTLALGAKAPLVSLFTARVDGGHIIEISPPIDPPGTGDRDEDVRQMANAWTRQFEAFVRRYPQQWVWHHRRWRTQPRKEDDSAKEST